MILFGIVSALTLLVPAAIILVGRGGRSETWPPDRPIEWQVFLGGTGLYLVLWTWLLTDSIRTFRAQRQAERTNRPPS
jgi:hypothetical protein